MSRILRAYANYLYYPNLRTSRIETPFYYMWFALVGAMVASNCNPPTVALINVILVMPAISICVYSFNDVKDMEIDKINPTKSNRPLPSGKVTVKEALSISLISGLIGLSLALLNGTITFLLSATYIILGIAYSQHPVRLKQRFILKEATIAIGIFLAFVIGGSIFGTIPFTVLPMASLTSIYLFAVYPLFIDPGDVESDRIYGCKTLAMVLGWKRKVEAAIGIVIVIMTLTTLTYAQFGFNVICPIIVSAMCLLFLKYLFPMLVSQDRKSILLAGRLYRIMGLMMQASFILGSHGWLSLLLSSLRL